MAWRSLRWWLLGIVCVVLLAVAVFKEAPLFSDSIHSFGHLQWWSLLLAIVFETGSMISLAAMERRILMQAGFPVPFGRSVAVAYASNAMSQSLPLVGSGVGTGFTYKRLVAGGAAPSTVGWALILAGVVSNAAFAVVICVGGIVSGSGAGITTGVAGLLLTAVLVAVAVVTMKHTGVRDRVAAASVWSMTWSKRLVRKPAGDPAELVAGSLIGLGAFHPNRRDVIYMTLSAFRNWTFDLLCLAFSISAAGAHVPWWGIILAWAAGAGGSSLNLTPGGIGVVEAALTGSLVALGVPAAPALTAVLVYRLITFWLAIAIGWPLYYLLIRRERSSLALPSD